MEMIIFVDKNQVMKVISIYISQILLRQMLKISLVVQCAQQNALKKVTKLNANLLQL